MTKPSLAARDADIGFACLTRPVHDTTHHGDAHRDAELLVLDGRLDPLRQASSIDLRAAAGGACDQVEPSRAEPERLERSRCRPSPLRRGHR